MGNGVSRKIAFEIYRPLVPVLHLIYKFYGHYFSYIAAQGPSQETMNLFWEMIWQQNVRVIVMLTNLIEGIGFHSSKCSQYWPDLVGNTRRFHDISVQLYDCQDAPDYLVRKFDVSRNEITRSIVHVQCTSWPDRCAPKNVRYTKFRYVL